ncbi:MAG: IS1634 family transposase [Actinomycetota bacterium]|nr:IS1634 family transposase [Actinomycetota bacterium]
MARKRPVLGPERIDRDKVLGSLPVVADFCRRLDIRGVVDRSCPVRNVAIATHGQVIEALVANRLTSPQPLLHVEDWAREWAVAEVFGVEPDALNDDRVGRALDAVAPALAGIVGSVGLNAIAGFGIDTSRIHWDMTSMSLFGDYDIVKAGFAEPSYGHPKDRRVDLKQIQTGLGVTGDGGIPIFHRAFDGRAGEINQVVGAMESLRAMCGPRRFLLVGDTKLISYGNVASLSAAGMTFIAPASKAYVGAETLRAANAMDLADVAYIARRDAQKGPEHRGCYRVGEDGWAMAPTKGHKGKPIEMRRIFVWSSADAGAAASAREKKLDRAREDLDALTRGLGGRYYASVEQVCARVVVITTKRRVGEYLVSEVGTDASGRPTLDWQFDSAALDNEAATDGWYCLLTNLDPAEADAGEVLVRYKGQEVVERRYGNFKGPLAVAPIFLKNNRRIEALLSVICLALLIFCLVERQVRHAIAPEVTMTGFPGRPKARPTGRLIFEALGRLPLIPASATGPPVIPAPSGLAARILSLLDVDPTSTR